MLIFKDYLHLIPTLSLSLVSPTMPPTFIHGIVIALNVVIDGLLVVVVHKRDERTRERRERGKEEKRETRRAKWKNCHTNLGHWFDLMAQTYPDFKKWRHVRILTELYINMSVCVYIYIFRNIIILKKSVACIRKTMSRYPYSIKDSGVSLHYTLQFACVALYIYNNNNFAHYLIWCAQVLQILLSSIDCFFCRTAFLRSNLLTN